MTESESLRAINKAIQQMAGTFKKDKVKFIWCQVIDYDINAQTCRVTGENDVEIDNVALSAGVCDGLVIYPTSGSQVVIAETLFTSDKTRWVAMFSDVDSIQMFTQIGWLALWNNGEPSNFQTKSFGGLVKIVDPNNNSAGILARLNNLENAFNNHLTEYDSHLHVSAAPTVNTSAPIVASQETIAPITQRSDLENPDITHGKL